jgi:hypothetical protein
VIYYHVYSLEVCVCIESGPWWERDLTSYLHLIYLSLHCSSLGWCTQPLKAVRRQRNLGLVWYKYLYLQNIPAWCKTFIWAIFNDITDIFIIASPIIFLFIHNHLTLRKWCCTPLQHDFAIDPIILPFDFHFRIYTRDLAILTEWWQQRIAWWKLINAACQINGGIIGSMAKSCCNGV